MVNVVDGFQLDPMPNPSICRGETVSLSVSSDQTDLSYQWTPAADFEDPAAEQPQVSPLETTTYTLTATAPSGCTQTTDITVEVTGAYPLLAIAADPELVCAGESVNLSVQVPTTNCGVSGLACADIQDFRPFGTDNTTSFDITPFFAIASTNNQRMQLLYTKEELAAAGIEPGSIASIGFNITDNLSGIPGVGESEFYGFEIKLGCTNLTQLNNFVNGLSSMHQSDFSSTDTGWTQHDFDQTYDWSGQQNLIVEICYANPAGQGATVFDEVAYTETSFNSVLYAQDDQPACDLGSPDQSALRPNIQFGFCETVPESAFSLAWEPAALVQDASAFETTATVDQSTTFSLTVTESGPDACTYELSTDVEVYSANLSGIEAQTICGAQQIALDYDGQGMLGDISWTDASGVSISTPTVEVTDNAVFYLSASDANGCAYSDSLVVELQSQSDYTISMDTSICVGESTQLTASGGTQYTWQPAASLSCTDCPDPMANPATTTQYEVTIANGPDCSSTLTVIVEVAEDPSLELGPDLISFRGAAVPLSAQGDFASIEWSPDSFLDSANSASPVSTPSSEITYTATAFNELGCSVTDQITIRLENCGKLTMPAAFSPNGDSVNDAYGLIHQFYDELRAFRIFDRYGKLIFETTDGTERWDGSYKGEVLPMGVYVYWVEALCSGEVLQAKGNVTLVR